MRVLHRSRQHDRLRVMLVLVHIDITPPHTPLPMFQRIREGTIPFSWRACKQLRHLVGCVIRARRLENCGIIVTVLIASFVGRHDSGARRVWFFCTSGSPMKEGRFVLGTFCSERMRVLYRSCQDDRLRVMLHVSVVGCSPEDVIVPQGVSPTYDSIDVQILCSLYDSKHSAADFQLSKKYSIQDGERIGHLCEGVWPQMIYRLSTAVAFLRQTLPTFLTAVPMIWKAFPASETTL
ncbi:uncharacterized protein TNCV_37061 [Trichonephila clavipes]|nr:uncharacterized protein TNCV_37061 [Trichonephila clavipes]